MVLVVGYLENGGIDNGDRSYIGRPLKRVYDFRFNRSLNLSSYYQFNMDVLEGRLQPDESGEWKGLCGEYDYRFPMRTRMNRSSSEPRRSHSSTAVPPLCATSISRATIRDGLRHCKIFALNCSKRQNRRRMTSRWPVNCLLPAV